MTPIDIYALNLLAAPVLLLFIHWARPAATWWRIIFISAPISWLLVNSIFQLDPPDNGFVSVVYLFIGWLWLPPICVLMWLLEWLVFKVLGIPKDSPNLHTLGKGGCVLVGLLMIAFTAYGVCGHISASAALKNADAILKEHHYVPTQPDPPQWINDHWLIRYPHSTFSEIELDRNGRMSRIDGP